MAPRASTSYDNHFLDVGENLNSTPSPVCVIIVQTGAWMTVVKHCDISRAQKHGEITTPCRSGPDARLVDNSSLPCLLTVRNPEGSLYYWFPSNNLSCMDSVRIVIFLCFSPEIPDEFSFSWRMATIYWL